MRAKKLGRHELLSWVNNITQSDYSKIENLSDGVAFCQIFDAFYPNAFSLNQLKFNSKNPEDWEKNFSILNEILAKLKTYKQIDPAKLTKCKFNQNFEFLQFVYDYVMKSCGENGIKRYNAFEKRLEILKNQNSNTKISDVRKYLPSHLIPNDLILKMEKQKYYGTTDINNIAIQKDVGYSTPTNNINILTVNDLNLKNYSSNPYPMQNYDPTLQKYKEFLEILKDDLRKTLDNNISLSKEIHEVEEERQYYLDKLKNVLKFCEIKENKNKLQEDSERLIENMKTIIKHQPEDFK